MLFAPNLDKNILHRPPQLRHTLQISIRWPVPSFTTTRAIGRNLYVFLPIINLLLSPPLMYLALQLLVVSALSSFFSFSLGCPTPKRLLLSSELLHNISQNCRRERPHRAPACPPSPHFLHWAARSVQR